MTNPSLELSRIIQENRLRTAEDLVDHFIERLVLGDVSSGTKQLLVDYLHRRDDGSRGEFRLDGPTIDKKVRGLVHLIALLPVYQLN